LLKIWYLKILLSKTYEKIEENSNEIWKNQRYVLLEEYTYLRFYELLFPGLSFFLYNNGLGLKNKSKRKDRKSEITS
jgi:hypothetical protein